MKLSAADMGKKVLSDCWKVPALKMTERHLILSGFSVLTGAATGQVDTHTHTRTDPSLALCVRACVCGICAAGHSHHKM